jgi:hypothetical protein
MTITTPSREEHIASFMEVLGLTREEAEEQHEQMLRDAEDEVQTPILDRLNAMPHRSFYEGCGCDTCLFGRGCKTEHAFVEALSEDEADAYHSELYGFSKDRECVWPSHRPLTDAEAARVSLDSTVLLVKTQRRKHA